MPIGMKYADFTEEWIELYEKGWSFRKIGETYKVDAKTVNRTISPFITKRRNDKWFAFADEWVRLYVEEGYTRTDIAKKHKTNVSQVSKVLKSKGIPNESKRERIYDKYVEEWITLYKEGYSLHEIAKKYGTGAQTVLNYLKEKEVDIRTTSEAVRRYHLNEDYFNELTKEKSYHLGLLFSIGTTLILHNSYSTQVTAGEGKKYILDTLLSVLREEKKGVYIGDDGVYRVRFNSEKLYGKVKSYGLLGKDAITFPVLKDEWIPSFILGYLEGEGKLSKEKDQLMIEGTHRFLQTLKFILEKQIDPTTITIEKPDGKEQYRMQIAGYSTLVSLYRWLLLESEYYAYEKPAKSMWDIAFK